MKLFILASLIFGLSQIAQARVGTFVSSASSSVSLHQAKKAAFARAGDRCGLKGVLRLGSWATAVKQRSPGCAYCSPELEARIRGGKVFRASAKFRCVGLSKRLPHHVF